jgi:hypothetical protein
VRNGWDNEGEVLDVHRHGEAQEGAVRVIHPRQTNNGSSLLGSEVVWNGVTRARYLTMRAGHLMSTGTERAVG